MVSAFNLYRRLRFPNSVLQQIWVIDGWGHPPGVFRAALSRLKNPGGVEMDRILLIGALNVDGEPVL